MFPVNTRVRFFENGGLHYGVVVRADHAYRRRVQVDGAGEAELFIWGLFLA